MAATEEDNRTLDEKKLFELIEKGTNESVIGHVKSTKVKIDCLDPKGMTPLQLAAFRGNKELCEFFLANGADVNSNFHENSYSALMFAALSGNRDVTRLMLEAGANVNHINSVNRTAAQMAAFVGQHQCVSTINNFFPRDEIDYYTKPQGLEKEAKLPLSVAPALCTLINSTNLHPVKISMYLQTHQELLTESRKVCLVLSRLVEKNMKSRDVSDILAIKCHFFSTVIKLAAESREKDKEKSLNSWFKCLMKGREEDGFMEFQERLVRQALKEFPYASSALLQQLVRQIAPVKIGNEPTAISVLISGINGQQFAWDSSEGCDTCWEPKAEAKCAKCKMVVYCNKECQRLHWPTHKKFCAKLAEDYRKQELRKQQEEEEENKRLEEIKKIKESEEAAKKDEEASGDNAEKTVEGSSEDSPTTVTQGGGDTPTPPTTDVGPVTQGGGDTPTLPTTDVGPVTQGGGDTPPTPTTDVGPVTQGGGDTPTLPTTDVGPVTQGGGDTPTLPTTDVGPVTQGGGDTPPTTQKDQVHPEDSITTNGTTEIES